MTNERLNLRHRLSQLRDALTTGLLERDTVINLALLAALASEHLLLLGPPGTAKSLAARRLALAFQNSQYFERLLTRFSVPEELFGPLSIKALEQDQYTRLTNHYLPSASIAFLDEIFKANSAILNAILTLLNEREFDNGSIREKTPLIAVIAASNELPEGPELDALYDRFLLRFPVEAISAKSFHKLLEPESPSPKIPNELKLTRAELHSLSERARGVRLSHDLLDLLMTTRTWCQAQSITVSDRRWRKLAQLLRISAASNERDEADIWDAAVLPYALAHELEQIPLIRNFYLERVGIPKNFDLTQLTIAINSWETQLETDQKAESQRKDPQGRPLFKDYKGKETTLATGPQQALRDGKPLYRHPQHSGSGYPGYSAGFRGFGLNRMPQNSASQEPGLTEDELGPVQVYKNEYEVVEFKSWGRRKSYLANSDNWILTDGPNCPLMTKRQFTSDELKNKLGALQKLLVDVTTCQSLLDHRRDEIQQLSQSNIWLSNDLNAELKNAALAWNRRISEISHRAQSVLTAYQALSATSSQSPARRTDKPAIQIRKSPAKQRRRS